MYFEGARREMVRGLNYLIKFAETFISTGDQEQLQTLSDVALNHITYSENYCNVYKDEMEHNIRQASVLRRELESKIKIKEINLSKTTYLLNLTEGNVYKWEGLVRNAQQLYKEKEETYLELKKRFERGSLAFVGLNVATAVYGIFLTVITVGVAAPIAVGMQTGVMLTSSLVLKKAMKHVDSAKYEYNKYNDQLHDYCKEKIKLQNDCKRLQNECDQCRKEKQKNNEKYKHLLEYLAKTTTLLEFLLICRHFISILQGRTEVLMEARKDIAFQHDLRLPLKEILKHLRLASSLNSFNLPETQKLCENLSEQIMMMPNLFSCHNICDDNI